MDTTARATSDDDKDIQLTDWIDTLEQLGIDTKKTLEEEHALIEKQHTINAHWARFRSGQGRSLIDAATKLSEEPADYDSFANAIITASIAADPSAEERTRKVVGLAAQFAGQAAYNHFRKRGEGVYKLITPVFTETRDAIIRDGAALPEGVNDLDTAARAGVEQEWLRLEALIDRWSTLLQLIESWYVNRVLPTDGHNLERLNVWMFVYENYEEAANTYGSGILGTIRQVINGDATLLTIDQVDELGSNKVRSSDPNEKRASHHRQQQADDEANAILRAEWEANGISPRLAAASAKRRR
ncbi:hypothetical protein BIU98_16770 [Curtobacterium sp. MMLR14_010]|uniref:hypothetical protein n=1 Tax=Curtobacterium sp. MMLR14_010 TaxID=1898743 RepID=UPI0008DCCD11|nr:hypothetical protein [Curtobacterium sp. MMLR14_010]OII37105.1 hypothetical protein BIU98_16770 [Curtobacterium sp. MMLR14_010]